MVTHNEVFHEGQFRAPLAESEKTGSLATFIESLGDDPEFGGLKRRVIALRHDNAESKLEHAPLPARIRKRADRKAAYAETVKTVSKWVPLVNHNRAARTLNFPLNGSATSNTGSSVLRIPTANSGTIGALTVPGKRKLFAKQSEESSINNNNKDEDLNSKISLVLQRSALGSNEKLIPKLDMDEKSVNINSSTLKSAADELAKTKLELMHMRELAFRHELKVRRAAKIKSKGFRRIAKRLRTRQREAEDIEKFNDLNPEKAREELLRIESDRARQRATLKRGSKGKWAQFMLGKNKEGSAAMRVLIQQQENDQKKEEQTLRHRIRGINAISGQISETDNDSEDSSDSDKDQINVNDELDGKKGGLFGMKFMQRGIENSVEENQKEIIQIDSFSGRELAPARHINSFSKSKDNNSLESKPFFSLTLADSTVKETDENENPWALHYRETDGGTDSKSRIGRVQKRQQKILRTAELKEKGDAPPLLDMDISIDGEKNCKSEENKYDGNMVVMEQRNLVEMAFAGDDVVQEFIDEKMAAEDADAPKEVNDAMPGWGSWGGEGIKSLPKPQIRKIAGISKNDRRDAKLKHVIINERRPRKLLRYMAPSLPHPFVNEHHYETARRVPIGKEWTTAATLAALTAPSVTTKAGVIIQPPNFVKQDADRLAESIRRELEESKSSKMRRLRATAA